jgi:hypothetical protein
MSSRSSELAEICKGMLKVMKEVCVEGRLHMWVFMPVLGLQSRDRATHFNFVCTRKLEMPLERWRPRCGRGKRCRIWEVFFKSKEAKECIKGLSYIK